MELLNWNIIFTSRALNVHNSAVWRNLDIEQSRRWSHIQKIIWFAFFKATFFTFNTTQILYSHLWLYRYWGLWGCLSYLYRWALPLLDREVSLPVFVSAFGASLYKRIRVKAAPLQQSPFNVRKFYWLAYTLPSAAGNPNNMIQKQETQKQVLGTHKPRFIFLYFSDSAFHFIFYGTFYEQEGH